MTTSFDRLTIPQQADLLLQEGFYLHTREEPAFFVDLYKLHGRYVEIYFHKTQQDFVVIKSFYSDENNQPAFEDAADILYPLPLSRREIAC